MKRYLILILTILVLASGLMISCSQKHSTATFKTYTNETYGYSIQYPSTWKLDESGETVLIYRTLQEHISIGVMQAEGITTEDLEWLVGNMTVELQTELDAFMLISKGQLYDIGYPAWEIVYTGRTNEGLACKFKCRCIAYRDKVYVITIGAPGSELPSKLDDVISSFTFQKQAEGELEDYFAYWDKIFPLGKEYLEAINAVLDSDKAVLEVLKSRDESRLLEVLAIDKSNAGEALNTVNSGLLSMANIIPPPEAQALHSLIIESLQTAQTGLIKWCHCSDIIYNKAYSQLHHSIPSKEYPDTSEEMSQARQLIGEALNIWEQVTVEMDNLQQILEQKAKN